MGSMDVVGDRHHLRAASGARTGRGVPVWSWNSNERTPAPPQQPGSSHPPGERTPGHGEGTSRHGAGAGRVLHVPAAPGADEVADRGRGPTGQAARQRSPTASVSRSAARKAPAVPCSAGPHVRAHPTATTGVRPRRSHGPLLRAEARFSPWRVLRQLWCVRSSLAVREVDPQCGYQESCRRRSALGCMDRHEGAGAPQTARCPNGLGGGLMPAGNVVGRELLRRFWRRWCHLPGTGVERGGKAGVMGSLGLSWQAGMLVDHRSLLWSVRLGNDAGRRLIRAFVRRNPRRKKTSRVLVEAVG